MPSIVFSWLGAFIGWKYYVGAERAGKTQSRNSRNVSVATVALLVLVVSPNLYSRYWETRAIDQVRMAVRAIQSGVVPENVSPFKNVMVDVTAHVESLVGELTPETEYKMHHKIGGGFHSYEVEIWPTGSTTYKAIASHYDRDGWKIRCCWRDSQ